MRIRQLAAAVALGGARPVGLRQSFTTEVSRYQAMPAPQGQTFIVVPGGEKAPRRTGIRTVRRPRRPKSRGAWLPPCADAQAANMIVELGYDVDSGVHREDPRLRARYAPFWHGHPYYYPRFGRYYGSPFYYGWDDPFWYGGSAGSTATWNIIASSTSTSVRRAGQPLFDGRAEARSTTNRLDALLARTWWRRCSPAFPGQNGEVVRITIPPAE